MYSKIIFCLLLIALSVNSLNPEDTQQHLTTEGESNDVHNLVS
jgi:hypothetical protein